MVSEWRQTNWQDISRLEYGKALRGYESSTGKYPVYGTNGPIGLTDKPLISGPTVVIGRKGAYRGVHFSSLPCHVIDTAFYLEVDPQLVDIKWAYYQLLTYDINAMDSGSAIPSTSRDAFYQLPVKLPPLPIQRQIAAILSAFDDKIELNRQMNRTLEQMARALFKSWFVDFEPVRAKMRGEQPDGMDAATAALFPNELVEVDGREVPKGWRMTTLSDLIDIDKGLSYKGAFLVDAGVPMVNLGTFSAGAGFRPDGLKFYSGEYKERHTVKAGDIVVANTDLTQKREIIGSPAIIPQFFSNHQVIFTHHTFAVRNNGIVGRQFIYQMMQTDDYRARVIGFAHGTTVLAIPKDTLLQLDILLPQFELVGKFCGIAESLFIQTEQNNLESAQLAQLRDALLPRLLSGGVDVSDWGSIG